MNTKIIALACFALIGHGRRVQSQVEIQAMQADKTQEVIEASGEVGVEPRISESSFVQVQWAANPSPHRLMPTATASTPQVARNPAPAITSARSATPVMNDGMAIPLDAGHMEQEDSQARSTRSRWLGMSALSVAMLPLLAKRVPFLSRFGAPKMQESTEEGTFSKLMGQFNNLFAVWLALAAVAGVQQPSTFLWVKSSYFTGLLGLLMFSVGITTTIDDFKACLDRPGAVAINFFSCYAIMPVVAYALAKAIGADGAILAGMVLVGAINGGQASIFAL
jgi:hypothetical protein